TVRAPKHLTHARNASPVLQAHFPCPKCTAPHPKCFAYTRRTQPPPKHIMHVRPPSKRVICVQNVSPPPKTFMPGMVSSMPETCSARSASHPYWLKRVVCIRNSSPVPKMHRGSTYRMAHSTRRTHSIYIMYYVSNGTIFWFFLYRSVRVCTCLAVG
ncbi:hypothetical protein PAXRUDRAFT_146721, partial [Paxillus rubicundulus Ve08.2h10]